jgi:hypothetical protein
MTLAPETGEVSWVSMGLRRVLFLAEVLYVVVEVPGFSLRLEDRRFCDQVLRRPSAISGRVGSQIESVGDHMWFPAGGRLLGSRSALGFDPTPLP